MHPNAIQKIEKIIKGSLINCQVKDNWPQYESFSEHVDSLGNEVLKHKKEWIDSTDIFSIFYDFVYEAIKEKADVDANLEGNLWDLLGEERGNILTQDIKNFIISIPRKYDVYISIPNISDNIIEDINISGNISLVKFNNEAQAPGIINHGWLGYLGDKLQLNKIYFKQRVTGYCGKRLENICLKRAFSNFKIFISQAIMMNLFKISPIKKRRISLNALSGISPNYEIPKVSIKSVDLTWKVPKIINAELPLELSNLINNISFDWESGFLVNKSEQVKLDKLVAIILQKSIELIEYKEEESKRIKSAIEWWFNSFVVENQTLSFLQICIGLEALLGDEGYNGSLTETLADRCSYLISNDIRSRKRTKDNFKELYNIRSRLIHGNVLELDSH